MRVLHLAPPSHSADRVTAHSFIDEEIFAMQRRGVECCTVSDAIAAPEMRQGVAIGAVAPQPMKTEAAAALAFAARHAVRVPSGVLMTPLELVHALRIELAAAQLAAERGVDVIHSHFGWPAGFGGALAAAHAGVPLVASLRGMDVLLLPEIGYGLRQDGAYDAALRRLLRTAARTVYATDYMRQAGVAAGAPPDRAVLIRKGVDLARFHPAPDRPAARVVLGIEGPIVLAVGSLSRRKGYDVALEALARVRDLVWTFVVCGGGNERESLEATARSLEIADRVRFAGSLGRDEVAAYFAAADVFVHPAVMEAAGNVILEALAAGCPVVCTDSGGPREYVGDGRTGFVTPPGDRDVLADRLRTLLASPALRMTMALSAREAAEQEYAYSRMIDDYLDVYRTVIAAAS